MSWAGAANTEYIVLVAGVSGFTDVGTFNLEVSVSVWQRGILGQLDLLDETYSNIHFSLLKI